MPLVQRGSGASAVVSAVATSNTLLTSIDNKSNLNVGYDNTSSGLGLLPDTRRISITGHRKTITSAGFQSNSSAIVSGGLDIFYPTVAGTFYIASTSTADDFGSTGATVILLTGLDSLWNPIVEQIVLDGQTSVATASALWFRVNFIQVIGIGSGGNNAGVIAVSSVDDFTAGVPQIHIIAAMEETTNLCFQGHYSVRLGHAFLTTTFKFSTAATESKPLEIRASFSSDVGGTQILFRGVELTAQGNFNYVGDGFATLPEKSDIQIFTNASATTVDMATIFWSGILFNTTTYSNAIIG